MATTSIFLSVKLYGQRSLADYSPWGCTESEMTEHIGTHAREAREVPVVLEAAFHMLE